MNTNDVNLVKSILGKYHLRAKKSFGQNFLVEKDVLNDILISSDLKKDDVVLEIGPGLGVLTEALSEKVKLVLAIEKDFDIVSLLRDRFKNFKNVKIIHADILSYNLESIESGYSVVSNLPYNISSPVIRLLLESVNKPREITLMLQKEVAERLTSESGSSKRGILTVMIELFGKSKLVKNVSREAFYPVPDVDSAIIKINIDNNPSVDVESFMRLVKIGFSQKRRQIHHPLMSGLKLPKDKISNILKSVNIDSKLRAEDLTLKNWIDLFTIVEVIFSNDL